MSFEMLPFLLVALLIGAIAPIQAGVNATIAQFHGHPLYAALTNTLVASLVLLVVILFLRLPLPLVANLTLAPW